MGTYVILYTYHYFLLQNEEKYQKSIHLINWIGLMQKCIFARVCAHKKIFSKSYSIILKSDCIYHSSIYLDLNGLPFRSK